MKQLLESGVHFGHQTRRWNPKMKRYIFTERNGIYIIDLQQSLAYIDRAYEFIKETVAHGGTILYVGTKKQAQEAIAEQARRVGMPFVNQRWLGGMLTNFSTVYKRLQRLKELEEIDFNDVAASGMTKKELLHLRREHDKLDRTLGGIRDMARVPSAIWVVDTKKEHIAINEARKLGIPVVAILDTNCDPDEVNFPIPGNDDAIRSVALLTRVVADAVAEGLIARAGAAGGDEKPAGSVPGAEEPLAEWERELLTGSQQAPAQAPAAETGETAEAGVARPADTLLVEAAAAEGAADLEIHAESPITSEVAAEADEADDQEAIAEEADAEAAPAAPAAEAQAEQATGTDEVSE
jgi:small subunit ribosomal protein S2